MKDFSQSPVVTKARSLWNSLVNLRIKEEHSVSVKIYNADSQGTTSCEHHINGGYDHSIVKAVAAIGAIALVTTAFCTACSFVRK